MADDKAGVGLEDQTFKEMAVEDRAACVSREQR